MYIFLLCSGGNNFTILDSSYGTFCGFTEEEIRNNFKDLLEFFDNINEIKNLKKNYNGYKFTLYGHTVFKRNFQSVIEKIYTAYYSKADTITDYKQNIAFFVKDFGVR